MPFPADVLAAWGIDGVDSVDVPSLGTMNETWLVTCSLGRVVLRRHRRSDRDSVAFEHQVIEHARTRGIPCPAVILTLRAERIVERGGHLHSLYSWEPGAHAPRGRAGPRRAFAAGQMLARIHDALKTVSDAPDDGDGPGDLAETYDRIRQLEDALSCRAVRGPEWIRRDLHARRTWLDANPNAPACCVGEPQVIHGDYQLTNVLFDGDVISAVIDWDKARVASPVMEVVRSLDHGLGLASIDSAAFLSGYRTLRVLSERDLAAAVEYWTHQQARSMWALERICLDGDTRVLRLSAPFQPFGERWAAAQIE